MALATLIMECTVQNPLQEPTGGSSYYRLRGYQSRRNRRNNSYSYINLNILVPAEEQTLLEYLSGINPRDRIIVQGTLLSVSPYIGNDTVPRASLNVLVSGSNSVMVTRRYQPREEQVNEAAPEVATEETIVEDMELSEDPFADVPI